MNNLITVFDLKTALRLEQGGFSYAIKKIGKKKKAYCFPKTEELMNVLNRSFEKTDWIEDNILTF